MIWNSTGRKQKAKDYKLHNKFILDENSLIYREIRFALSHGYDFIANLGHSTFLISYKGIRFLTDPFLSPHIFGIRRQKPALRPDLVPEVDFILISHAHYDHLDMRTLRRLKRNTTIILPENTKPVLGKTHFKKIVELKHYSSYREKEVEIISLPVKHNKGRSILFPNTETSSYVIKIEERVYYFGGDTAYFDGFKEYGREFSIHTALLPIGGYEPTLLLHKVHMNPYEAVQAFIDLKAEYVVPIHYGTFHTIPKFVKVEAPLKYFKEEIKSKNLEEKAVIVEPNAVDICVYSS
ncbi:L-ascorbate metabolism protein UlaG, beta-lactamase superfamily [Persephonella hydrogeniphila]|uniref:L-ascorbate metabolism protein UlaG, beta-lactamase superfamily n=1 Tax=Persephonella hydrogeniphila TaxID=198703 RepID=A0A285NNT2_9AQUI|nr:MBL fold metallo-hydrolase [Persephonella hydrogeniphila]SNZ11109.1 L-ascorbate metabolism protein UlaG, beta-lactamase superfamily [Persephonella hydrogeniphila]